MSERNDALEEAAKVVEHPAFGFEMSRYFVESVKFSEVIQSIARAIRDLKSSPAPLGLSGEEVEKVREALAKLEREKFDNRHGGGCLSKRGTQPEKCTCGLSSLREAAAILERVKR